MAWFGRRVFGQVLLGVSLSSLASSLAGCAGGTTASTPAMTVVATPSFSVAAGTYMAAQTVAIADATAGATIYYTTNGTVPTTASAVYSGPVMVAASETLEAIAAASGDSESAVASAAYVIQLPAATPTFSVAAGTYTSAQTVTIADATAGATIYYTTNGTAPTTASTVYSGVVAVGASETLEAIAAASGDTNSAVASAAYVIQLPAATPTFSVAAGTYTLNQVVSIMDATSGATIYYTTNGTMPTTASMVYGGPLTVGTTETLEAIAVAPGSTPSAVASGAYVLNLSAAITGTVTSSGPVKNAHVYLFAANTTGYGQASMSLLSAAATGHSDLVGAYVLSGTDGSFSLTGNYSCTAGSQLYLYALDGDAGSGLNPALGMLAALGPCGTSASPAVVAHVNEVTTIAAAYALAGFAVDATHVSSSGTALAQVGVANAFANAGNMVNLATGVALATTPAGNGTVPQSTLNLLSKILSSCIDSAGSTSSSCTSLLSGELQNGTSGTAPTDTATVAVNIAHNPASNLTTLFGLSGSTSAPATLSVEITYPVASPGSIGIDGSGAVWMTSLQTNAVSKLSSTGMLLSPSGGFSGGGLNNPSSIAIDPAGNAWISNYSGGGATKLSSQGIALSPSTGFTGGGLQGEVTSIAVDGAGNAWLVDYTNIAITELSTTGTPLSPAGGFSGGGLNRALSIAIDGQSNVWVGGLGEISEFTNSGVAISSSLGFQEGLLFGGSGDGIAIDNSGDIFVANSSCQCVNGDVEEFSTTGVSLIPGQNAGRFIRPVSVAVDGLGNIWIANSYGVNIDEISNPIRTSQAYPITSSNGLDQYCCIALDGSGDVWLADETAGTVIEFVGTAAPVVTPLSVGVMNNALGTRP